MQSQRHLRNFFIRNISGSGITNKIRIILNKNNSKHRNKVLLKIKAIISLNIFLGLI
ncbi:hypothetical protein J2W48_002001 [Flavobacterium piscis]|uniref:Uncharacterized protein n=1 Tax=Flavobacterium piscis TaxID=1114874 RepID=A0ABU1Y751_9FLAO|nr:hypothetical protein [Flavobacterium piscis]